MDVQIGGLSLEQPDPTPRAKKAIDIGRDSDHLAREIAHLLELDDVALKQRWTTAFKADPSPYFGRLLMIKSIAYRLQEKTLGCLKKSTEQLLDRISDAPAEDALKRLPKARASAGTILIRQWRGVRHRVTVLDHEVVYRGQRYKSLSEVARLITGTRWSGPLFFGLRRRPKEVVNG
jgi:Protein of unknown function (DUF2924)